MSLTSLTSLTNSVPIVCQVTIGGGFPPFQPICQWMRHANVGVSLANRRAEMSAVCSPNTEHILAHICAHPHSFSRCPSCKHCKQLWDKTFLQFGSSRSLHVSSISMNMTRIKYIPKKNLVHLLTTPHLKVKKPSLECWSISNSVTSFINRNVTQDLAPDSLSFSHLSFASAMSTALSAAPRSSWSPRTHGRLENEKMRLHQGYSRMMNSHCLFGGYVVVAWAAFYRTHSDLVRPWNQEHSNTWWQLSSCYGRLTAPLCSWES